MPVGMFNPNAFFVYLKVRLISFAGSTTLIKAVGRFARMGGRLAVALLVVAAMNDAPRVGRSACRIGSWHGSRGDWRDQEG